MKKERLEIFTDAVIAIVMTLMILEIKLPDFNEADFWLVTRQIAVYALSFIIIAITWLNHHAMFSPLEKINIKIAWINFILLFTMSLIPLATGPLGEHFFHKESHMVYGAVMASVALPYTLLQINVNKLLPHLGDKEKRRINTRNWVATSLYLLSIPLSLLSIYLSTIIFVIFPIVYFIPSKKLIELK